MQIYKTLPIVDAVLAKSKAIIGDDFDGYRNHVYRMVNCCFWLKTCSKQDMQKIQIAAAFHDIGIWVDDTFDYLAPSVPPAVQYLQDNGLQDWTDEISLMITEHHKLRAYNDNPDMLVELFRKGDLVDFSLGMFRFGIDKALLRELKTTFPNSGFHKGLIKKSLKWFIRNPLNPAPMMKW
ncbi:MAG: hypothetical protein L3J04_06965 [Robiginitomaculum sp.]|nr:hypothetical protein [Robiginitomaculum sp.]